MLFVQNSTRKPERSSNTQLVSCEENCKVEVGLEVGKRVKDDFETRYQSSRMLPLTVRGLLVNSFESWANILRGT
jgi:hypothetical protein